MLDVVTINGYKSISEMKLNLKKLNVLIGPNGAGKSNFISFFEFLNNIIEENLQVYVGEHGGANNLLYFGRKVTDSIYANLRFGNNEYEFNLKPTAEDSFVFANEACGFYGDDSYGIPYYALNEDGHRESKIKQTTSREEVANWVYKIITSWKVYHFHDTSKNARIKQTGNLSDNISLKEDASNLAAFLYTLKKSQNLFYKNILETIKLVTPFLDDFVLEPSPFNKQKIQLRWKEKKSDIIFDADTLSDGSLRFACIVTLLLQPSLPSLIIIDEPELGLHPYAITMLANLLRNAAKKTQVIVSTQSVTLVNQFSSDDIIVVNREDKQSTFKYLDTKDLENWLDDYAIGDLWEKNIIGGRPS